MNAIPVISLEQARQGEETKVADEISRACTEVGFFVIRDHGIRPEIFDRVYDTSMRFFERPIETKR